MEICDNHWRWLRLKCIDDSTDLNKDLPARKINALKAVGVLLSSCKIEGKITPNLVKSKLFIGNKDMHPAVYDFMAEIIELLRPLTLKQDQQPNILNCCHIRLLRNKLVEMFHDFTQFNTVSAAISINEKSKGKRMAIDITAKSIYWLMREKYTMYSSLDCTSIFTSATSTSKDESSKELLFRNFFDVSKIKRILKE